MADHKNDGSGGESVQGVPPIFLPLPTVPQIPPSMQAVLVGNPQANASQWALIGQQGHPLLPMVGPNSDYLQQLGSLQGGVLNQKLIEPRSDGGQRIDGLDFLDRNQFLADFQFPRVMLPLGLDGDTSMSVPLAMRPGIHETSDLSGAAFGYTSSTSSNLSNVAKKTRSSGSIRSTSGGSCDSAGGSTTPRSGSNLSRSLSVGRSVSLSGASVRGGRNSSGGMAKSPSGGSGGEGTTNLAPLPGVKFCASRNAWIARWAENGQDKWKTFSVNTYGFEDARSLAIECRLDRVRRKYEKLVEQATPEHALKGKGLQISNKVKSPSEKNELSAQFAAAKHLNDSLSVKSDSSSSRRLTGRSETYEGSLDGLSDPADATSFLNGEGSGTEFATDDSKVNVERLLLNRRSRERTVDSSETSPSGRPIRAAKRRFLENLHKSVGSNGGEEFVDEEDVDEDDDENTVKLNKDRDLVSNVSPLQSNVAVDGDDVFDGRNDVADLEGFEQLKDVGGDAPRVILNHIDWSDKAKELPQTRGVCFDAKYQQWCYKWKQNTKQCKRSFAVLKYGFEKARELAIECKRVKEGFESVEEATHDIYTKPAKPSLFVKSTTSTASTETVSSLGACEARSEGDDEALSIRRKSEGGVDESADPNVEGRVKRSQSLSSEREAVKPFSLLLDNNSDSGASTRLSDRIELSFLASNSSASSSALSSASTISLSDSPIAPSSPSGGTEDAGSLMTEQMRSELEVHKKALILILDDLLQNCLGFKTSSNSSPSSSTGPSPMLLEFSSRHIDRFVGTVELHRQRILRAKKVEELGSCVKLFDLCIRQRVVPSQVEPRTQIVYLHALDALFNTMWSYAK